MFVVHVTCIHIFFLACALSGYIFVNPFTSCATDRYQYIMMENETETNMKFACIEILLAVCATCCYILLIVICPSNTLLCRPISALPIN